MATLIAMPYWPILDMAGPVKESGKFRRRAFYFLVAAMFKSQKCERMHPRRMYQTGMIYAVCAMCHISSKMVAEAVVVLDTAAAHHAAGVNAHPGVETVVAMQAPDLVTTPHSLGQQGQAAFHSALSVVFAGAGGVMRAEGHLEAVTGITQLLAAVLP